VELAKAIDLDLDPAVDEPDLDVAAGRAGDVEDDEVGVVALEQVVREWRPLLDPADAATDTLEHGGRRRLAELPQPAHSSISRSPSVPRQYGQTKSASPTSSGMS
jgi:hypothetical protein